MDRFLQWNKLTTGKHDILYFLAMIHYIMYFFIDILIYFDSNAQKGGKGIVQISIKHDQYMIFSFILIV